MSEGVRLYAGTQHGLFIWRSRGDGWEETAREFSDRMVDVLAGDRRRPERVYAAATFDGLYRSDDAGDRWTLVLPGDVRAVTVDPSDERVVYAGTAPVRLYRSEDAGATWEELPALQALPADVRKRWWTPYPPHTGHVRDIFVHPEDPRVLYLCLEHGGIVRSLDRGGTWEDVSAGIDWVDMHAVACLPGRKSPYFTASAKGFYRSDDPACGWVRAERGMTRNYFNSFLFLPPARPEQVPTMLVCAADDVPGAWRREAKSARAAIFRSDDEAESWYRVGHGLPEIMDAMVWGFTPHPTDPNAVFAGVGAIDRGDPLAPLAPTVPAVCDGPGEVLLTRDRGESWQHLDLTLPADRVLWAAAD
ncbi:MAG TPA: hypothetical protein VK066_24655 [Chloroflexota bacterium]|nr:hypothetical protein [Chloroflexota bacterium]